MKLLYFTRGWSGHDDRFARAFLERGIELGILTLTPVAPADASIRSVGQPLLLGHLGAHDVSDEAGANAAAAKYSDVERKFAPDIVLAGPLSDCAYLKAITRPTVPWVAQSWAFDLYWEAQKSPVAAERCRRSLGAASCLFADCRAVVEESEKLHGGSLASKLVMPWGLEDLGRGPGRSTSDLRARYGIDGAEVLVHSRGLEEVYGVKTLLDAFALHVEEHPSARLLLASEGSLRDYVRSFAEERRLSRQILMLGRLPHSEVLDLFAAADVYVSCALSDGTSVSLLEAMDAGLPAVVPTLGGNAEWIKDGANGWLVPPADAAALARALDAASRLTEHGRRAVAEKHRSLLRARANWAVNFDDFVHRLSVLATGELLPA